MTKMHFWKRQRRSWREALVEAEESLSVFLDASERAEFV